MPWTRISRRAPPDARGLGVAAVARPTVPRTAVRRCWKPPLTARSDFRIRGRGRPVEAVRPLSRPAWYDAFTAAPPVRPRRPSKAEAAPAAALRIRRFAGGIGLESRNVDT